MSTAPADTIADLRRQLEAATAREAALAEVLALINRSPGDPAPVFDLILEKALRICQPAFGSLILFEGDRIRFLAERGVTPGLAAFRAANPDRGYSPNALRMIETKRPVHQPDIRDGEGYRAGHASARTVADLGGARTLLLVPLLKEQMVIGAIQIFRLEVRAFSDKEIALLCTFAEQAVIAITSAETYRALQARTDDLQEALAQQTATAEVLQVINANPGNLTPVFDAILEKAMRLCEAAFGGLFLFHGERVKAASLQGVPQAYADYWAHTPASGQSDRGTATRSVLEGAKRPSQTWGAYAACRKGRRAHRSAMA